MVAEISTHPADHCPFSACGCPREQFFMNRHMQIGTYITTTAEANLSVLLALDWREPCRRQLLVL